MEELWTIATTNTWSVVVTGLLVVFVALIALVFFVWIIGKIFETIDKSKNLQQDNDENAESEEQVQEEVTQIVTEEIEEQDDSVIAVITAAISSFFSANGEDKPFAIKSIKRAKATSIRGKSSAWRDASIIDNTRPF